MSKPTWRDLPEIAHDSENDDLVEVAGEEVMAMPKPMEIVMAHLANYGGCPPPMGDAIVPCGIPPELDTGELTEEEECAACWQTWLLNEVRAISDQLAPDVQGETQKLLDDALARYQPVAEWAADMQVQAKALEIAVGQLAANEYGKCPRNFSAEWACTTFSGEHQCERCWRAWLDQQAREFFEQAEPKEEPTCHSSSASV